MSIYRQSSLQQGAAMRGCRGCASLQPGPPSTVQRGKGFLQLGAESGDGSPGYKMGCGYGGVCPDLSYLWVEPCTPHPIFSPGKSGAPMSIMWPCCPPHTPYREEELLHGPLLPRTAHGNCNTPHAPTGRQLLAPRRDCRRHELPYSQASPYTARGGCNTP